MSTELNQLLSSLSSINREFDSFSKILSANSKSTNMVDQAFRATANSANLQKATQQALSNSITGAANSLTSFAKSLANNTGSFEPLTSVITTVTSSLGSLFGKLPFVGGALDGIIKGGGQVAVAMVQQFEKTYGTFEKLSDVGIVTTFSDLRRSAELMNLSIADTEIVMTKHSKDMALWSASALDGRKQFEQVAFATTSAKLDFQKLGISSQEFTEMQASFVNQQMKMSGGQQQTTQQMANASLVYMKELDAMAKLTGASRKSIQAQDEARLIDARYRAMMMDLPAKARDNVNSLLRATVNTFGPKFEKGMRDVLSSEGNIATSPEGKTFVLAMQSAGMNVDDTFAKLKNGTMEWQEVLDQVKVTSAKNVEANKGLAQNLGESTDATGFYVEMTNGSLKAETNTRKTLKEIEDQQNQIIKDTESDNAKLAATKQNMENLQKTMERLATESSLVTGLLDTMSNGLLDASKRIADWMGVELDPIVSAEHKLSEAVKDANTARLDLDADRERTATESLGRFGRIGLTQVSNLTDQQSAAEKNVKDTEAAVEAARKILNQRKTESVAGMTSTRGSSAPVAPSSTAAEPVGANSSSMPSSPSLPSSTDTSAAPPIESSTATASSGPVANTANGVSVAPLNPTTASTGQSNPNIWRESWAGVMFKMVELRDLMQSDASDRRREALSN